MAETKKSEIAAEVLNGFDFDKMHAYMTLVGWDWRDNGVPSKHDLFNTARDLVYNALENKSSTGTGGFEVVYNDGEIQLYFSAIESSCEWDEQER